MHKSASESAEHQEHPRESTGQEETVAEYQRRRPVSPPAKPSEAPGHPAPDPKAPPCSSCDPRPANPDHPYPLKSVPQGLEPPGEHPRYPLHSPAPSPYTAGRSRSCLAASTRGCAAQIRALSQAWSRGPPEPTPARAGERAAGAEAAATGARDPTRSRASSIRIRSIRARSSRPCASHSRTCLLTSLRLVAAPT